MKEEFEEVIQAQNTNSIWPKTWLDFSRAMCSATIATPK
jgi:hypothetical protein